MKKTIIIVLWVVCGFFNYGLTLGYFIHKFPEADHRGAAFAIAILGPCGAPASLLFGGPPYHWRLKSLPVEERWKAFHEQFPDLDREYFEKVYN